MYNNNSDEPEALWFGIPDQQDFYPQPGFENVTLHPTYGVDLPVPADPSTPLLPFSDGTPPLAVDIINGEISPVNTANDSIPARARPTSPQMFKFDKLASGLLGLYCSISHDASASQSLYKLVSEILDVSAEMPPGYSRVDLLVVPHEGRFHCPFVDCQKKGTGWAAFRDAREHIWIDHLSRRFPCSQNGCQEAFSRVYDKNRHVREIHKGLGKSFICTTCQRRFTRQFNLKRHIKTHDLRDRRSVID